MSLEAVTAETAATCAGLLTLVLCKPSVTVRGRSISIYWLAPVVGALLLWLFGGIGGGEIVRGLTATGAINPIKILVLFLSMTLMSVFLDNVGFFQWLAEAVLHRAGVSQKALFFYLYTIVSVLTIFTSNDIVVLTFTPFICYFSRRAGVRPLPYLLCEFVAANTWSMALIIGNPTNLYLATGAGISFVDYMAVMALPTIAGGLASLLVLWVLFRRDLREPMRCVEIPPQPLTNRAAVALGVGHLSVCLVLMVLSSYLSLPMWAIAFGCCVSLFLCAAVQGLLSGGREPLLRRTLRRAPWETVPFVLAMFVLVLALERAGATERIAGWLSNGDAVFNYGVVSFAAANLVNNIPMSVLFSTITEHVPEAMRSAALYACVIGSNIGAFFTPVGALAGIMWTRLLKDHGVPFRFIDFVKYGTAVAVPSLAASLLALTVVV